MHFFSTRVALRYRAAALGLLTLAPLYQIRGQGDTEVLSNATIVQMVTGKLSRDLIVSKINASRPGFDLSSDGIIYLWTNRVDDRVIRLMLDIGDSLRTHGNAPKTLIGLDEVLKNDNVVKMVTAHVPKPLTLQKLQMSRSAYDVSATGLVNLKASKVPEDVIKVMMSPPAAPATPATAPAKEPVPPPAASSSTSEKSTKGDTAAKPSSASKKPTTKTTTPPQKKKPPQSGADA